MRVDYRQAELPADEMAMLVYVEKITTNAAKITPDDHAKLRENGFDEKAILQITLLASWFNYINRVADALGVGKGKADEAP